MVSKNSLKVALLCLALGSVNTECQSAQEVAVRAAVQQTVGSAMSLTGLISFLVLGCFAWSDYRVTEVIDKMETRVKLKRDISSPKIQKEVASAKTRLLVTQVAIVAGIGLGVVSMITTPFFLPFLPMTVIQGVRLNSTVQARRVLSSYETRKIRDSRNPKAQESATARMALKARNMVDNAASGALLEKVEAPPRLSTFHRNAMGHVAFSGIEALGASLTLTLMGLGMFAFA